MWGETESYSKLIAYSIFQSTLPVWGETSCCRCEKLKHYDISIHSPRVGRDPNNHHRTQGTYSNFNPLSPCGERLRGEGTTQGAKTFQSTLPVWGETLFGKKQPPSSIFQSTLPVWGETPFPLPIMIKIVEFQSTLPVWGETFIVPFKMSADIISIHSPRVGRDPCRIPYRAQQAISIHSPRVGRDNSGNVKT